MLLSIRADIPSGPLALDVSSDCNSSKTSDLEHSNSCGQTLCDETLDADGTRGGTDVLKHCSKNSFNMLALQASLVAVIPLWDRTGTVHALWLAQMLHCFLKLLLTCISQVWQRRIA